MKPPFVSTLPYPHIARVEIVTNPPGPYSGDPGRFARIVSELLSKKPWVCRCGKTLNDLPPMEKPLAVWENVGDTFHFRYCSRDCERRYGSGCFFCGGPAHPASGHAYSSTCLCCERCYREFLPWFKSRLQNPIAAAATAPPGTRIEGEWTEADQAKRDLSRARRRKT